MHLSLIFTIALKELRNGIRNRWILVLSLILLLLAWVISYFGTASAGKAGFGGFDVTIVSLVSLVAFLIPIVSMTMGFDSIVGESEGKTLDLLLTMPISRMEIFIGKFFGYAFSMIFSVALGFGLAGALILWQTGSGQLGSYVIFVGNTILLGLVFLSLSMAVSAAVSERSRAIGWVIFFWFFFVLIFDLVFVGILVATKGAMPDLLVSGLLYLNPTDLFRLVSLSGIEGVKTAYGLSTLTQQQLLQPWLLYTGIGIWMLLPLLVGYLFFKRR